MKSTTDWHRDALEQALRVALATSQPALRKQAMTRAAAHLIHPKLVLESPLLTDAHPWRKEALLVSDAFEAVTNGMEDPGLLEALDTLDSDSPFQDWKHLVLAIHFYYEGLDEAVTAHLGRIPADSPLRPLGKTLEALVDGTPERLPAGLRRLADQVAQPDPVVHQLVQDIAEGLETEQEDLFWSALAEWLERLAPEAPEKARAAVVWAWNQLEWREFDEAELLNLGAHLWGRAESYRLAALGTLPWDPEGATLLWLRFLVTSAREGAQDEVLIEGTRLLERFQAAIEGSEPDGEWTETWTNLCWAWNAEVQARQRPGLRLSSPVQEGPVSRPAADGQLDLFA